VNSRAKELTIGLIGTGFMGKTHVYGFAIADRVFDLPYRLKLVSVADVSEELAQSAALSLGFESATSNWMDLINDKDLDLISITSPNVFHKEMAIAALNAGKHVYCEKPLAPTLEDSEEMVHAAGQSEGKTQVGFNYLSNPMIVVARDLIKSGELGDIMSFRGIHAEDYMSDPESSYTWRHDPIGGGVLGDLGSHILATAEFLLGPISEVLGDCVTVIPSRKAENGERREIIVDDISRSYLKFATGVTGSIEASWLATGRKMQHDFEVHGTLGSISYSQERLNELHFFSRKDNSGLQGFRKIEASPEHEPYGRFCVAPGHQLGFNDLKAIEISKFVKAIEGTELEPFNFESGHRIQLLINAIRKSSVENVWTRVTGV
tara:strand:+ start:503 stop:1633 length:1131 start_codon:yes stop_codon:yes gene_type:complete